MRRLHKDTEMHAQDHAPIHIDSDSDADSDADSNADSDADSDESYIMTPPLANDSLLIATANVIPSPPVSVSQPGFDCRLQAGKEDARETYLPKGVWHTLRE